MTINPTESLRQLVHQTNQQQLSGQALNSAMGIGLTGAGLGMGARGLWGLLQQMSRNTRKSRPSIPAPVEIEIPVEEMEEEKLAGVPASVMRQVGAAAKAIGASGVGKPISQFLKKPSTLAGLGGAGFLGVSMQNPGVRNAYFNPQALPSPQPRPAEAPVSTPATTPTPTPSTAPASSVNMAPVLPDKLPTLPAPGTQLPIGDAPHSPYEAIRQAEPPAQYSRSKLAGIGDAIGNLADQGTQAAGKLVKDYSKGNYATTPAGLPWAMPLWMAAGAGGVGAGWTLTDWLLDKRRKQHMKQELDDAKQEYNESLFGKTSAALDELYDELEKSAIIGTAMKQVAGAVPGVMRAGRAMMGMPKPQAAPVAATAGATPKTAATAPQAGGGPPKWLNGLQQGMNMLTSSNPLMTAPNTMVNLYNQVSGANRAGQPGQPAPKAPATSPPPATSGPPSWLNGLQQGANMLTSSNPLMTAPNTMVNLYNHFSRPMPGKGTQLPGSVRPAPAAPPAATPPATTPPAATPAATPKMADDHSSFWHPGNIAGTVGGVGLGYAGVSGLMAGLMAYDMAKKRQRRTLLESAQKERQRSRFESMPTPIYAVPVPVKRMQEEADQDTGSRFAPSLKSSAAGSPGQAIGGNLPTNTNSAGGSNDLSWGRHIGGSLGGYVGGSVVPAAAVNAYTKALLGGRLFTHSGSTDPRGTGDLVGRMAADVSKKSPVSVSFGEGSMPHFNPFTRSVNMGGVVDDAIAAHELGHAAQPHFKIPKLRNLSLGARLGGQGLAGLGGTFSAFSQDEDYGLGGAIGGSLATVPTLIEELDASRRGYSLLGKHAPKMKALSKLRSFAGVPTYAAMTAMPSLVYAVKKLLGGYKLNSRDMLFPTKQAANDALPADLHKGFAGVMDQVMGGTTQFLGGGGLGTLAGAFAGNRIDHGLTGLAKQVATQADQVLQPGNLSTFKPSRTPGFDVQQELNRLQQTIWNGQHKINPEVVKYLPNKNMGLMARLMTRLKPKTIQQMLGRGVMHGGHPIQAAAQTILPLGGLVAGTMAASPLRRYTVSQAQKDREETYRWIQSLNSKK